LGAPSLIAVAALIFCGGGWRAPHRLTGDDLGYRRGPRILSEPLPVRPHGTIENPVNRGARTHSGQVFQVRQTISAGVGRAKDRPHAGASEAVADVVSEPLASASIQRGWLNRRYRGLRDLSRLHGFGCLLRYRATTEAIGLDAAPLEALHHCFS
jgi:hypothetical protein